jgi:hypothetical protein
MLSRRDSNWNRFRFLVISPILLLATCGDEPRGPLSFSEVMEVRGSVTLEEPGDAVVGEPNLRQDPMGGWLFWDGVIPQVRRYDPDGALLAAMGRQGEGPGEFSRVAGFMRTQAGKLVTVDQSGRIAIWNDSGDLIREFLVDVGPVASAVALGDRILLARLFPVNRPPVQRDWLHLVDVEEERVVASAPAPEVAPEYAVAALVTYGPDVRAFDGGVHAGVAVLDTIWSWGGGRQEGLRQSMVVPWAGFAHARPPPDPRQGGSTFQEWLAESWSLGGFLQMPDGRWLFQASTFRDEDWVGRLLLVSAGGDLLWEAHGAYRILEVDSEGWAYLWDAVGSDPAEILVARPK